jgi:hypothetical protein
MKEIFETKVTRIKNRWHTRLILIETGKIVDEMACDDRRNIGYCCHEMLRWADKLGWDSPMARATRRRNQQQPVPDNIWYNTDLIDRNVRKYLKDV